MQREEGSDTRQQVPIDALYVTKVARAARRKAEAVAGRVIPLRPTLDAMALRPYELHLELTNLCNADCVFCPYHSQQSKTRFMSDAVFHKAVDDFVACGGGSVGLTPIVGDALIHPAFLERVRYLRSLPSIDRIWLTTNAILLDKFGIGAVLDSGLTSITISTAGFERSMYERVYRSTAYPRMLRNVTELVEKNSQRSAPLPITIALRPDRPRSEVMKDPDFQPILAHRPQLDFAWAFGAIRGNVAGESLLNEMRFRLVPLKAEACVQTYNGLMVLADGTVIGCSCVAAMDAQADLTVGNILTTSLLDIWQGEQEQRLRASFGDGPLNGSCASCDVYRNLDLYRTSEGRERARLNRQRSAGQTVRRSDRPVGPFPGG